MIIQVRGMLKMRKRLMRASLVLMALCISAVGKGRVGEEYHIFLLGWKEDRIHDYCSE